MKSSIPISDKAMLTLEEAAGYFNIGTGKLREMTNDDGCAYVLWVGHKRLIKRRLFEHYLEKMYSI